ncbi:MAG: FkbM family methyltransferase [Ruminococcaceae bacterium]|nr:FkbM family methyltransferase [Oscillospiraceae bacterium]
MSFFPTRDIPDLWHYLKIQSDDGRPILLYGMGNGADKILAVCEKFGITVKDCFASDGFVRGHSFHGRRVLSFSEARKLYGDDMLVLLSFASSRPDVLELIERVAAVCELYAPDVPVCGNILFDNAFYEAHKEDFFAVRTLLEDDESRNVFDGILAYKLSGRIDILRATESKAEDAYRHILHADTFRTAADLGAYNGDSLRELMVYAPFLTMAVAMEPDRRNFAKLTAWGESLSAEGSSLKLNAVQAGAFDQSGTLHFHASGNRNATLCDTPAFTPDRAPSLFATSELYFGKTVSVAVRPLDQVWAEITGMNTKLDYIKYDVEGSESAALRGSQEMIRACSPALLVSLYHRSEDLFELPLLIQKLNPNYRFYLRRMAGIPAWDINLYCVKS